MNAAANPRKGGTDLGRDVFGAYVCGDDTKELMAQVVGEFSWPEDKVQSGGIANAIRSLTVMMSPEFLVVDLSDSSDPREDINALAEVCEPGTLVLAMGKINDVTLYRDLRASGILDYLIKPLTGDDLREALGNAETAMKEPVGGDAATEADRRTIAVVGSRGGAGASLFSASSAWILANELGRKVSFLDLDIHFGTGALAFDLEPGRGLCDALENPSRVDALFIERATTKASENLAILGAEAPLSEPVIPDPAALSHLLSEISQTSDCVLIDLPRNMASQYSFVLSEATDVCVVSELTLSGTRDTLRVLAFLREVAAGANVHLIANKTDSNNEVSVKDFEASVEHAVDWSIPLDTKSTVMAAKKGQPLVEAAGSSKPAAVIREVMTSIAGGENKGADKSFWKKMLK